VTDSNVFQLFQPGTASDPLTEVLRSGDGRGGNVNVERVPLGRLGGQCCQGLDKDGRITL